MELTDEAALKKGPGLQFANGMILFFGRNTAIEIPVEGSERISIPLDEDDIVGLIKYLKLALKAVKGKELESKEVE